MNIYEKFLEAGRKELIEFKNDPENSVSSTGIENTLVEPFLSQIIELNKYMNTTASTNEPSYLFQAMFIDGWIHKKYITPEFLQKLKDYNYNYVIRQEQTCCKSKHSKVLFTNYYEKSVEHDVLMDMLCMWWFDKDMKIPNLGHKDTIEFRENYNHELPQKFRKLYEKYSFLDAIKYLNDDDWKELNSFKNGAKVKYRYYEHKYHVDEILEHDNNGSDSEYCCIAKELIENGEVLLITIENLYDPTDRNLYTNLINLLK